MCSAGQALGGCREDIHARSLWKDHSTATISRRGSGGHNVSCPFRHGRAVTRPRARLPADLSAHRNGPVGTAMGSRSHGLPIPLGSKELCPSVHSPWRGGADGTGTYTHPAAAWPGNVVGGGRVVSEGSRGTTRPLSPSTSLGLWSTFGPHQPREAQDPVMGERLRLRG